MKLRPLSLTLALGATALAACGSDASSSPSNGAGAADASTATDSADAAANFNDADVEFTQGMIPHHQQAVEMAELALDPATGASAEVQNLATQIRGAQGPEVAMMNGWMTAWGQSMPMDMGDSGMSATNGMMSADEMMTLESMQGADFDATWIEMMIRHHQGAIAMAETAKANGSSPEALALADQIITAQQAEIAEMTALLAG